MTSCQDKSGVRGKEKRSEPDVVMVIKQFGAVEPSINDDRESDWVMVPIPASLEAYVATRSDDAVTIIAKLVERCARTGFWTVVTAPLESSIGMIPCRFGAGLMLRRSCGLISAAIVARDWSITLRGDEAWVDVVSPGTVALSLMGTPVRSQIDMPFLSTALRVCAITQIGAYFRFHCQ